VSVYCMDKEDGGFTTFVLIKKGVEKTKGIENATWDSINVVDVKVDPSNKTANYKITSTVILEIGVKNPIIGDLNLSGSMTKQREEAGVVIDNTRQEEFHLGKIGSLVEDNETNLKKNS